MSLQISSCGNGPDLALVHGWGLGSGVWSGVADALAAHCRVHLVSLPGYAGAADDGADFDATADALAGALPAGTTCCGWSLGGMLALAACSRHPGHFGRLAMVGSTARFVQAGGWQAAQPPELLDTFRRAIAGDTRATLSRFVMLFNQGDARGRAVTRTLTPLLDGALPQTTTLLRGLDWLAGVDLRERLPDLALKTMLLHGDQDPLMPYAAAEAVAATIPGARLERFSGCAHAPFISMPEPFVDTLRAFCHEPA